MSSIGKHLHTVHSENYFNTTDEKGNYEEITSNNTIDIYMYPTNKNIVFQIRQQFSTSSGGSMTPDEVFMELDFNEVQALHQKLGEYIAEKTGKSQKKLFKLF